MSMTAVYFWTAFLSFLPVSELRGAIPFAVAHDVPWYTAFFLAAFLNALVAPVCWIFLSTFNKLFLKMKWYSNFFERFVERARSKLHSKVERWGWFGIAVFVAIPLPFTGAWTGTLGAWVLGLSKRKTMAAVVIGVIISGTIVSAVVFFGVKWLNLFIKSI